MTFVADFVGGVPVPFSRLREIFSLLEGMQEGAVGPNDLKVAQRAAGATMSVDVGVGDGFVQIDSGTRNGLGHVFNDTVFNAAVGASNASNPRVDRIVLFYNDTSIPAGVGGNIPTVGVLAGNPTVGATLDNLLGAQAVPNDALLLADVLVPAASSSVVTANIRDRRKWARGAYAPIRLFQASDVVTASNVFSQISASLLQRVEVGANAVRMRISGRFKPPTNTGVAIVNPWIDGANPISGGNDWEVNTQNGLADIFFNLTFEEARAAGSHLFNFAWRSSGSQTIALVGNSPIDVVVEEIVKPAANNGVT